MYLIRLSAVGSGTMVRRIWLQSLLSRKSLALPVMSYFGVSGSHLKNVPWFQRRMRPPQKVRNSVSVY